ncbi:MAG TPA: relaxase/mobilization nuclease domain-containing protein [Steroidobacteraceae bacterium]
MPKTLLELRNRPLLDIASYGRGGPGGSLNLSADQIAAIDRTVRRVAEVMVKVLPKDSNNLRSVARHFNYIGRYGKLELETDDVERIQGKDAGQRLLEDWDLDLDKHRREVGLASVADRAPKLVHKIMLSMPPGTPPKGVLDAARNFAREQFALKHRYALVLHTDEPHPHVHLVVKAVSEQGERLNIRKATLREWRGEFARHLREQGVSANATERAVRGQPSKAKKDGIYRATLRGDSTHARTRAESVASELLHGGIRSEPGKSKLIETRMAVDRGWHVAGSILAKQGHPELAARVHRFLASGAPLHTDKEQLAAEIMERAQRRREHTAQRVR